MTTTKLPEDFKGWKAPRRYHDKALGWLALAIYVAWLIWGRQ